MRTQKHLLETTTNKFRYHTWQMPKHSPNESHQMKFRIMILACNFLFIFIILLNQMISNK